MTKQRMTARIWRRHAIAFAIVVAGSALALPAGAQLFEDRPSSVRPHRQQAQPPDFFPFSLFGDHGSSNSIFPGLRAPAPQQPVESFKAPPPHKIETPPTSTVLVIGDSLADWLGYGLEEAFAETPEIGIVRKIRPYSGLVRYEAHNDTLEWPQAIKDMLATEKPNAIVVMLGLNDRQPLRERIIQTPQKPAPAQGETPAAPSGSEPAQQSSGATDSAAPTAPAVTAPAAVPAPPTPVAPAAGEASRPAQTASYEFHTDKWAELYAKRIDEMIAALKSKGVPVVWVGLPAIRGTRTTSDMSYLDELYRARAERAGITYVDIWDGFVDDQGRYAVQGPDFEGQIRKLRTSDGVHFTKAGAVKLGHYVEHDLRRVLASRTVPVALPGAEEQSPAKAGGAGSAGPRPVVGPVVPLNAGAAEGGDLLGAGSGPAAVTDPIATRVLSRGDAIAAPAGRADNFSWPRADASASTEVEIAPVAAAPPAPPSAAKGSADKRNAKKPDEAKPSDAKPPRRSRAGLDGAPRPPLPVGPATANTR